MLARRALLAASVSYASLPARAQSGLRPEWLGAYSGTLAFYGSMPLDDAQHPPVDLDDRGPIATAFRLSQKEDSLAVWLRIDDGPMETATAGETLRFGPLDGGVVPLVEFDAKPAPRSATLTVRPDLLGTEALFAYADGSFWRRHFNVRFTPTGADLIVWVFDAAGTRARSWRGSAIKQP